jgi:hypothetical protein
MAATTIQPGSLSSSSNPLGPLRPPNRTTRLLCLRDECFLIQARGPNASQATTCVKLGEASANRVCGERVPLRLEDVERMLKGA